MEQSKNIDVRIGEAWKAHYQGQDKLAIEQFTSLVKEVPDNVDAHWGLALSYRDAGDLGNAAQSFETAKSMIAARLEGQGDESAERERYVMLSRMVEQQITQLAQFSAQNPHAESGD